MDLISAFVLGEVSAASSSEEDVDGALHLMDFAQSVVQGGKDPQGSRTIGYVGGPGKRHGLEKHASALDKLDSPDAGSRRSHGKTMASRPPTLRPHVCSKPPFMSRV